MATLVDIARETNTSVSTVSRVLAGGNGAKRISEATRTRVLEAARRMGYRPNLVARSLRTRRSHTVALLLSDIANPWFGQIASLVEQSLHRHGYSLMLCNSGEDLEREQEYLRLLPSKGIDGLIVVPLTRTKKGLLDALPPNLPIVVLDRPIPGIASSVYSDQDQSAGILCDVLERVGVRKVGLVAGPQHVVTHRRRAEIVSERFTVVGACEGPAQRETGRRAWIQFLHEQPQAIVCTNNFLGQGVIDGMADAGQEPPIIGVFDEIPMMHLLPIPIVASVQDVAMLAEGCVQQLLPQLRGEPGKGEPIVLEARAVANAKFQELIGRGGGVTNVQ
jgi:LacI family transcriptional regulator